MTRPGPVALVRRVLTTGNVLTLAAFLLIPLAVAAPLGLAPLLAGIAVLLGWAALSCLWSADGAASLRGVLQLAASMGLGTLCFAHFAHLEPGRTRRVAWGFLAGMALALAGLAALVIHARLLGGDGYIVHLQLARFSRGTVFMALAVLPAMAALRAIGAGRWALILPLAASLTVMVGSSGIAKLSLATGLGLAGLGWAAPRLAPRLVMAGMTAAIIALPLLANALPSPQDLPVTEPLLPLHPHSCTLQWWLELGAVGVALAALFLARLTRVAARAPGRSGSGAPVALVGAAFVMAQASFGAWQSWWLGGLWLLAGLMAAFLRAGGGAEMGGGQPTCG